MSICLFSRNGGYRYTVPKSEHKCTMSSFHTFTEDVLSAAQAARSALNRASPPLSNTEFKQEAEQLSQAIIALLSTRDPRSRHDLLNLSTGACGYAEMLLEDLEDRSDYQDLVAHLEPLVMHLRAQSITELKPKADESSPLQESLKTQRVGQILVVDDQAPNRELLRDMLERYGHTIFTAHSGESALEILRSEAIDIILLDLSMPGMGGKQVLAEVKSNENWRATPVIVISGHQEMANVVECIELGADDYLFKPFNAVLLRARINAGLERKSWLDKEALYLEQLKSREAFIRATFGRYLTDDIVADILEKPEGLKLGGDARTVTIMMADIRGFTAISDRHSPEQVVSLLNTYLAAMTDVIMAYGGTIDEFLGDAILAVFGAPKDDPRHASKAVQCAVAMQSAVAGVNIQNASKGLPPIETGIAINTGTVVAGNIGSERRAKYGFVGAPMNITARIEDLCDANEILISDTTRSAAGTDIESVLKGEFAAKGIEQKLSVYTVVKTKDTP